MNKIAAVAVVGLTAFVARPGWTQQTDAERSYSASVDAPGFVQKWPDASKTIAAAMIEKYGQPEEFNQGQLVWKDRSPWKRIVVHRFPVNHFDILEQAVNYTFASPENTNQRIVLNESVVVPDVPKSELASFSNSEDNNILALNLANDVLKGRKSPEGARKEYTETRMRYLSGKTSSSMEMLEFYPQRPAASDRE